jgi:hypothetical protein
MERSVAFFRGRVNDGSSFQQLGDHINMAIFGSEM